MVTLGEGQMQIVSFTVTPPSPTLPGEIYTRISAKNIGETDYCFVRIYLDGALKAYSEGNIASNGIKNLGWGKNLGIGTYIAEGIVGHIVDSTEVIDDIAEQTIMVVEAGDICTWVTDKGGPNGLTITDVFEIVDAYIFNTIPPGNYDFIPTLQNIFGIIDYFLGFNGDSKTGCAFF